MLGKNAMYKVYVGRLFALLKLWLLDDVHININPLSTTQPTQMLSRLQMLTKRVLTVPRQVNLLPQTKQPKFNLFSTSTSINATWNTDVTTLYSNIEKGLQQVHKQK